jgi:hypothetical protein
MCCYVPHTKCQLFPKRRLTPGQAMCLLRHGKRTFEYYLAIKHKMCCGVFISCYPDCWIEVVTAPGKSCDRPAISTPVGFLAFSLSSSKCSDCSQDSKLLLHASHEFFPFKVPELMPVSIMVTKFFLIVSPVTVKSSSSSASSLSCILYQTSNVPTVRHGNSNIKQSDCRRSPFPQNTLFIIFCPRSKFELLRQKQHDWSYKM